MDLSKETQYLKSLQHSDGYWWFTLEANESIGSEFIFLMHYLGEVDKEIEQAIARRIGDVQRNDGTWGLYDDAPPDLSATIECYFALKLAGFDAGTPNMAKAREFILSRGGIEKSRVFTKIHLAMFGLVPWDAATAMPAEFILLPNWFPVTIYEFSSWARATIVPLLVLMSVKTNKTLSYFSGLDEIFCNPPNKRDYSFKTDKSVLSPEHLFIILDRWLKFFEKFLFKPLRRYSINKCLNWIWTHIQKTEDIYPALAYGALAFKAAGYSNDSPEIRKPFEALKMFQQSYTTSELPALPDAQRTTHDEMRIHQQCCISPVWDTPWVVMALLSAGVPPNDPALLRAGEWLIAKQITTTRGDWAIKNPKAEPGGWAFEFENGYFPDVDDTIEVLIVLHKLALQKKRPAIERGLAWLISMQNDDGGWGAFDKNQTLTLVNRIPFSDHGACLDPSSPDITGRMLEFLASQGFTMENPVVRRALNYIRKTLEPFGGWFARWGINYIYGTWCVLTGLNAIGFDMNDARVLGAVNWLKSVQREDGGFGESPESYVQKKFVPWNESVPSQTAWGLMGLTVGGKAKEDCTARAAEFLLSRMNKNFSWDEMAHTGTGFPGHFYIRYHGYRHYFPLLALARYKDAISPPSP